MPLEIAELPPNGVAAGDSRLCAAETKAESAEKLIELETDSSGIMRNTPRGEIATSKWNLHVRFIGIHNCPSDLNRTLFL